MKTLPGMVLFGFWFVGLCGWIMWFRNTRRSNALAVAAAALQLKLNPAPTDDEWSGFGAFAYFSIGFAHSARNCMNGTFGSYQVTVLDYCFRRSKLPLDVEVETSSRQYHQTVVAFWEVSPKLPNFQMLTREKGWFKPGANRSPKASVAELHIGKAENADFHRHYLVGGKDEVRVRAFFSPPLLTYFATHPGWDLEAADGHLLLYQECKLQPPAKMQEFLDGARQVVDTLRQRTEGPRKR